MATMTLNLPDGRILAVEHEPIETTSYSPTTDKDWTFTDAQGHQHRWDNGYPTLRYVVDEEDYVIVEDGHPEEYPGSGHYECVTCGEHITPGMKGPSRWCTFEPGSVRYTLDGLEITKDEADALVEGYRSTPMNLAPGMLPNLITLDEAKDRLRITRDET